MATPTQRLTARAQSVLGENVILAVRVRQQHPHRTAARRPSGTVGDQPREWASLPAAGFPVVAVARSLKDFFNDLFDRDPNWRGVLAFTESGERILLTRSRRSSLRPTEIARHLRRGPQMSIDIDLLYEDLIAEIKIEGEYFIVNSVDFRVLTRAVVEGRIDEPWLKKQLKTFYQNTKAMAAVEPTVIRSMIAQDLEAEKPEE